MKATNSKKFFQRKRRTERIHEWQTGTGFSSKPRGKGDNAWLEATKPERTLLKILGKRSGIPREAKDRNTLDVDYKACKVFFGRKVAGEGGENGEFQVHVENITQEVRRMGRRSRQDFLLPYVSHED